MTQTHQDRVAAKAARLAALRGDTSEEEAPATHGAAAVPPPQQPEPVVAQPEPERAPAPPSEPEVLATEPEIETLASSEAPSEHSAQEEQEEPPAEEGEAIAEGVDDPDPVRSEAKKEAAAVPKPRQSKGTKKAAKPVDDEADESKIVQAAVSMDRDLLDLIKLALPALGGPTLAKLVIQAARLYRAEAAELPDSPVTRTVIDDWYEDVDTEAQHRAQMTIYMTKRGRNRLDQDAGEMGRSSFVRRVLRRYLTIDKVFVDVDQFVLLQSEGGLQQVLELLETHANRPARALPAVVGQRHRWAVLELREGTPLRAALDAARESMPDCRSATQALLTVLS